MTLDKIKNYLWEHNHDEEFTDEAMIHFAKVEAFVRAADNAPGFRIATNSDQIAVDEYEEARAALGEI